MDSTESSMTTADADEDGGDEGDIEGLPSRGVVEEDDLVDPGLPWRIVVGPPVIHFGIPLPWLPRPCTDHGVMSGR